MDRLSVTAPLPRRIGVVGLGLMGASLARGLKAADGGVHVLAAETREEVRARAVGDGVVDEVHESPGGWLEGCELVVLCTPIAAIEALIAPVSCRMSPGSVLCDVGGAKEQVLAVAREDLHPQVSFVGAHPMFGGRGGYEAARADRWRGGTVAVCTDGAPPEAVERVAHMHRVLGAEVAPCTAAEHDAAVAMVSHLPYLLAASLSLAARRAGPLALKLAGPGLNDMTRLAGFAFDIQGEVARRNAHLPAAARELEGHLRRILGAIAESPEAARQALEEARAAREEMF
jgi:prephenate dehydrogenase